MADWIKIRHSLLRSPKLRGLMRELKCNKHTALGLAVEWFCWIDEQTENGETGLTPDELADELGFRGCAKALCSVGWAALGDDGTVNALEFGKHCGDSAKKRAEEALKKARQRANVSKNEGQMSPKKRDKCPEKTGTNVPEDEGPEKKRKEENNNKEREKASRVRAGELPMSDAEVYEWLKKQPLLALPDDEKRACASNYFSGCAERGWVTRDGIPIRDWHEGAKRHAENWARKYAEQLRVKIPRGKHRIVNPEPDNGTLR